jgi:hypothetical protein
MPTLRRSKVIKREGGSVVYLQDYPNQKKRSGAEICSLEQKSASGSKKKCSQEQLCGALLWKTVFHTISSTLGNTKQPKLISLQTASSSPMPCLPLLLLLKPLSAALPLPPAAAAPVIAGATTTTKMSTSDINLVEHWFNHQRGEVEDNGVDGKVIYSD